MLTAKRLNVLCVVCGPFFCEAQKKHGDFTAMIAHALANAGVVQAQVQLRSIDIRRGDRLPPAAEVDAVIFSGSVPDVDDSPFVVDACAWICEHLCKQHSSGGAAGANGDLVNTMGVPMLGLCYGHQLLGCALGGQVGDLKPEGEFGTRVATFTEDAFTDPLCKALIETVTKADQGNTVLVNLSHNQTVLQLPRGAVSLMRTVTEPHQLVRFAPLTYGTQFHPEFTYEFLMDGVHEFEWTEADKEAFVRSLQPTPVAERVIPEFVKLVALLRGVNLDIRLSES